MSQSDNNKKESIQKIADNYSKKVEKWLDPNRWFGRRKAKPDPDEVRFVGFNDRMFAMILDTALSLMLVSPILIVMTNFIYRDNNPQQVLEQLSVGTINLSEALATAGGSAWVINNIMQFSVIGIIFIGFWIYSSATPGKWILRMRIVDQDTGMHPNPKQFIIRFISGFISPLLGIMSIMLLSPILGEIVGMIASFIIMALGFLWIIWDREKQGWHDKIANTVVVKVNHWRIKASEESEFPDSWFEEYNDTSESMDNDDYDYDYDGDSNEDYIYSDDDINSELDNQSLSQNESKNSKDK